MLNANVLCAQDPPLLLEPEPVYDDDGNPTFIVVQVELFKPLIPKKAHEEVEAW